MAALAEGFREKAILLGPRNALVGVVTRPLNPGDALLPAIVILNTGIVHRVGHHRMYVTLSRLLAGSGRMVVRFDLSGIGDSNPRNDLFSPLAAALADIREVLDSVAKSHRASRFVLVGLCSGADLAVLYSHTDPRVAGLVLMDPTLPPTPRYYFHYLLSRLGHTENWLSVLSGRSGVLRLMSAHLVNRLRPKRDLKQLMLQNVQFSPHLARCYADAAKRGMKLLAAFTSVSARHTYKQQILDAFPEVSADNSLQLQYFPTSDHLFSAPQDRTRLFGVIASWVGLHWPASPG